MSFIFVAGDFTSALACGSGEAETLMRSVTVTTETNLFVEEYAFSFSVRAFYDASTPRPGVFEPGGKRTERRPACGLGEARTLCVRYNG